MSGIHLLANENSKILAWTYSKVAVGVIDWLLGAFFVLTIFAYAYLGSFSRYMADDYSAVIAVRRHGFFGAQIVWYQEWSGRFSFTFADLLLALIGPITPRFTPTLLLIFWTAAAVWAMYGILSLSGEVSWNRAVLFAGFLIISVLATAPNVAQSLYWQAGALTYVAPLIPVSLYVGVLTRRVRASHKRFRYNLDLVCAGVLTLVAGGFSDAYVVMQTCGLSLSIMALEIHSEPDFKSRVRPFLVVGLIGSLLALIIVAAAPGNNVRQSYFPMQLDGWQILKSTALYSIGFVTKVVLAHPLISLALVSFPLFIRLRDFSDGAKTAWDRRVCFWLLLMIPIAVFLLLMSCIGPAFYGMGVMLPERARIFLSLILVGGAMVWGRAVGEYLVSRLGASSFKITRLLSRSATAAILLLILFPLSSMFSLLRTRERALNFANDWDRQDSQLKAVKQNGFSDVEVRQIGDFQSRIGNGPSDLHLRTDPTFWINRTTANYYGLRSVRASSDGPIIP